MELKCKVQNYEWGKPGSKSTVANLLSNAHKDIEIDENLPYAELWMGTHVNGPSMIKSNEQALSNVIKENPHYLGNEVLKRFGQQLPFLFKVLSVNKALSIQAHPNKKHAEELHAKYPNVYKDPNHKPELAIALTPFEALCGFRPISQIKTFMKDVPEFRSVIGENICNASLGDCELLKKAFTAVLTCSKEVIARELDKLLNRVSKLDEASRGSQLATLVEKLSKQYPHDVGIFVIYFLNYIQLKPSQALYLAANVPHAYISGDCIECMACSDNVVRAGLTPKFIDVETLCEMLTYESSTPDGILFKPIQEDDHSQIFKPPVPDFAVVHLEVPSRVSKYSTMGRNCASILLVTKGKAKTKDVELKPGVTLFVPAEEIVDIFNISEDLCIYQALANV